MSSRNEALETIKQLIPTLSLADLTRVVLKLVRDQVGADRGTIFVVDHTRGEVRSIVADRVVGEISQPIGFGIAGSVAETGEVIDTYNPLYDDRYDEKYETILKYDTKDIYCAPIVTGEGVVVGVLQLLNRTRPFTEDDYAFLKTVSQEISPVLKNASVPAEELPPFRLRPCLRLRASRVLASRPELYTYWSDRPKTKNLNC
jgi:GAF domain-containing protein